MLDLQVPLERFPLELRWETREPSLGIFGPSGAGKTTVLESIAGLRPQARGVIEVWGERWLDTSRGVCLPPERRRVGYVPQDTLLFPHRDVRWNLLSGARRADQPAGRKISLEKVLEVLELQSLRDASVTELSGGEKQRVALGRALCSGPGLLLLDEPMAGLDLPLRRKILSYLMRVHDEFNLPTLFVSHDATDMSILSREVTVLSDGKVVARGRPETVFLEAGILPMFRDEGFENVLEGHVREARESGVLVELEPGLSVLVPGAGLPRARKVVFGLRAQDILLATHPLDGISAQNVLPGVVREVREGISATGQDPAVAVIVALGESERRLVTSITKQARARLAVAEGMRVHLVFKAQSCRTLASG